jgi:hypothetical protein
LGKVVSVKATGKNANPEFAKKLEGSLEEILRGEYVTLEEVLDEEKAKETVKA